ncbi:MAG: hypothetical protein RMJ56_04285 [Gemmataceae bacterium]|nr:hypothetical protein [Gemmata sp.]MDW8196808.1 hypothetical protein [Gemmataceae bacterium]
MPWVLPTPLERESLIDRLAELGRSRKRTAIATGVFTCAATLLGLATLAGVADAVWHWPPVYRALALVVILTTAGILWLRGVAKSLGYRTDALSMALELEERFSSFNDALASAVSFLQTDAERKPAGVSSRLLQTAVRLAERKAARLPIDHVVPTGAFWRSFWSALLVLSVCLPLILWDSGRAATALVRLADPFGAHPWPTKTQVEILAPEFPIRIAKGDSLELKFAVRGVLAGPATVHVRVHDGGEFEDVFPLALNNDPEYPGAAVVQTRLDAARLAQHCALRIVANDADTGWKEVTVVPPPRLVPLDGRPSPQIVAYRPTYTNLPSGNLPDGAAVIEVPVGTRLQFQAATEVPLAAATLTYIGDRTSILQGMAVIPLGPRNPLAAIGLHQLAQSFTADIPLMLSGDRTRMMAQFTPLLSGTYALKLTDTTGLTGTQLLEIRLTPDPVPTVVLTRPLIGTDPPLLTPSATIVLQTTAEDSLYGLRAMFVEYRTRPEGPLRTLPLAQVPNVSPTALAMLAGGPLVADIPPWGIVAITRAIPVSHFVRDDGQPLRPGDWLILRVAATDWDDVSPLKGPGRSSSEVAMRIATAEVIEAWLQRELAALRPELIRLRDQQRDAKEKVLPVEVQPGGTLRPADRDQLVSAERIQQQLRGKVADPRDGLRARADWLQATVTTNNLPPSPTTQRVEMVAQEFRRMVERDLATAEQHLADARQLAGQPPRPEHAELLHDALRRTIRHQKNIENTATALLDLLSQWGGAGEIRSEARVLRDTLLRQLADQEQLKQRVAEGQWKPTVEEQSHLNRAATKVEQLAEQAGQLIGRAARLAVEKDKQAADLHAQATALDATAAQLRRQAVDTTNPLEKSALQAQADAAQTAATDLRYAARQAEAEASALRRGLAAAHGQGLADDIRQAAESLRRNQQAAATTSLQSTVKRLEALADALAERPVDAVPELAKPQALKARADELDALAEAQDELRRKAEAASRLADPDQRQAALKALAAEQERLIDRGRELLQRLRRERADDVTRDLRAALDKMETARDDLEKGLPANRAQAEAVDQLDTGRDKLDVAAEQAGRQLSDEQRRQLADVVKSLRERQKAALAETHRIHGEVAKERGWSRVLLTSYSDLESIRLSELASELQKVAEADFQPFPVFARLLTEAATANSRARTIIQRRCDDADLAAAYDPELETTLDRKVVRPLDLALRRLQQLADALQPEEPQKQPGATPKTPPAAGMPPAPPEAGRAADLVPPLAQLKVLRALQAELNERTAEFAQNHPEGVELSDDAKAELRELQQAQAEIAELFEQMARMLKNDSTPPEPENP